MVEHKVNTNGSTIYASQGMNIEDIIKAFESDEQLWSKVTESKLFPRKGVSPKQWVLSRSANSIVFTTGPDEKLIAQTRKARVGERVVCECGRTVTRGELSKHRKTVVHQKWQSAMDN
jgi:hypothetical protein